MAVSTTTTTTTATLPAVMIYSVFLFIFLLNPSFSMAQSDSILYSGESLSTGDSLRYGMSTFIMQEDCNLVLYDDESAIWASNTGGQARNCYCSLQEDGNLVVYRPNGEPLWASNTQQGEEGHYVLILQKDRNVVIYGGAIWASNTNSVNSKRGGGTMNAVSIKNLPAPIIYSDGAKNVTGRITTRAGRVA